MKKKIRTDVPTLWLDEGANLLRIVWPDCSVWFFDKMSGLWSPSYRQAFFVKKHSYYCGPLFVSKENEP